MKMEGIELYPHNQKAYDNLCAMLRDNNRACVVQPTGTGKFVIIAKMAQDNPGKNFLLLGTNDYMYIDRGGTAGGYHWEYLDEKKEVSTDDHHQADGRAE